MRASLAALSKSLLRAHISPTPPVLAAVAEPHPTLPQLLASLPGAGVGATVRQRRWAAKGLDVPVDEPLKGPVSREERESREPLCYWLVTRTQLKDGGRHGKAWGRLVWRGKEVTAENREERIRGSLKYVWEATPRPIVGRQQ